MKGRLIIRSLNFYAYVGNNPLRFIDPSGHTTSEGYVVDSLIELARKKGKNSESYRNISSFLGTQALQFFPDAMEDGNNTFKYLYNMVTMTSSNQADNTVGNAG